MAKRAVASAPPKVVKVSSKAPVIVFDESKYGINRLKSLEGKTFARKNREEVDDDGEDLMATSTSVRARSNDPDDIADMEVSQLWERLKMTVEDVATSTLTGKARKKHLVEKAARLAGKEVQKPKAPFRIKMGMEAAAKKREKKAKEAAREVDGAVFAQKGKNPLGSRKNAFGRR